MVLRVDISAETESLLREKARLASLDFESFVRRELEKAANRPQGPLGEMLGKKDPSESDGWSDEALANFIGEQIKAARSERQGK
jgi:hypothetical protein